MNVNRRHLLTGSVGAAAVALTASACASEDGGGDGEAKKVGIAMPTKTSERWIADGDNLKAAFQDEGYEVTLQYANDEVDTQVSQIETMVSQGQDILVVAAINNEALNGVLAQAKEQDTTVIAYDRLILGTDDVEGVRRGEVRVRGALQRQDPDLRAVAVRHDELVLRCQWCQRRDRPLDVGLLHLGVGLLTSLEQRIAAQRHDDAHVNPPASRRGPP